MTYSFFSWKSGKEMGLSEGLVRVSIGLDNDIEETFGRIKKCVKDTGLI